MKGTACEFIIKMDCKVRKCELMFTADVLEKLNELKVKLQGQEHLGS